MRMKQLACCLAASVLLASCETRMDTEQNGTAEFAELQVSPTALAAGDQITLTLINQSDQQIGYNLCPVVVERRDGDSWQDRPERPAEVCTMELRVLEAGSSATYEHTVPSGLPAGTYRFRANVEWPLGGDQAQVHSQAFEVRQ